MKRKILFIIPVMLIAIGSVFYFNTKNANELSTDDLRTQHQSFLDNNPFKETMYLSKKERKSLGIPPNAYNEQLWEMTMSPKTGRPMPERVAEVQANLRYERSIFRGVGGDASNPWVDRGPNNQGGRTRGIMFDPNDANFDRVFAGGVSGGLWVNNDITDANSSWTQVSGLAANIAVTVIISDPNTPTTFYLGAGESYTSGDAIGNGVWKSIDSGVTWTNVLGGYTGASINGGGGYAQSIDGIFYINDLVARDVGATTELFAAVASSYFPDGSNALQNQWLGIFEQGLYKSTDNGGVWVKNGIGVNPNDIEIDINNNVWLGTTSSSGVVTAGGDIYRSTDGSVFDLMGNITGASRVELEPDPSNADALWALANVGGPVDIFSIAYITGAPGSVTITKFGAELPTPIRTEPADLDTGIPNSDFTRGQAFYDLVIESDASGNLYVGGIDLFRSTDDGITWTQLSKWSNNNNLATLNNFVHADQHAFAFRPGNDNQAAIGCDGGVFFANSLTAAASNTAGSILEINKDYNTVQFYYGAIDDIDGGDGDDIGGGTQDNGSQFTLDASAGANNYFDPVTGDGGYTEIDAAGGYAIATIPRNTSKYIIYPTLTPFSGVTITTPGPDAIAAPNCNTSNGSFINEAALDENLDILYANASFTTFVCATGATVSNTFRIERVAEFLPAPPAQVNTFLTDATLTARPTAFKVSPFTGGSTTLFVGLLDGKLLRIDTADGTPTWNVINGAGFTGSISDIEFGAIEAEIFVTMHNYDVTSIWFTSDGGTTWSSKEGNLADMPVKCILQNPLDPTEVIIGTQIGVWSTTDITVVSPVWVQSNNGMSDVPVLDLDLRPSDNVILASSFGRGMFTSQFSVPLSVDENSLVSNGIRIYPTISDGNFTIVAKSNLGNVNMRIYNITGQEVFNSKFQLSNAQNKFNLNVNSGIYFVNLKGDNFRGTQKIIIK
jgi:Secretion system C-terminal sorting domain